GLPSSFFFQAVDGIRVGHVTGVQTCALPISFFDGGFFMPSSPMAVEEGSAADTPQPEATDAEAAEAGRRYRASQPATAPVAETRSEERRVGKKGSTRVVAEAYK